MNLLLRLIAIVSLATCSIAHAYDATVDFSTQSNPNSVWQYGYSTGNGAYQFTAFDTLNSDNTGWMSSTYNSLGAPAAWKNTSNDILFGVAPGQLALHPGPDIYSPAVLRFIAPTRGAYSYFVQFYTGDSGQMNGSVFANNNIDDPLAHFPSTNGEPSTAGSIFLNAGDSFDVAVGNQGSFNFGNTPIDVVINLDPVPEPETTLLFVVGLAALVIVKRMRKA